MTVDKSNQADTVDMDKLIGYMNQEINIYWFTFESSEGNKLQMIHKVPQNMLEINRNAYEPIILSIGPYHHGAQNLIATEREKWKCLDFILKLNCELSLQDYVRAIYKLEKQARSYYSQEIAMDKRKLVQMLLLDSCFILVKVDGTIREPMPLEEDNADGTTKNGECLDSCRAVESYSMRVATENLVHEIELTKLHDDQTEHDNDTGKREKNTDEYDYNSSGDWYAIFAWHALFLLENQIPFFIVETVYNLALSKRRARVDLRDKIVECVEDILRQFPKGTQESNRPKDFHHLLHLCHMYMRPTHKFVGTNQRQLKVAFFRRLVDLGQKYFSRSPNQEDEQQKLLSRSIDCFQDEHLPNHWRQAVQYHETGVLLKKRECNIHDRNSLLDIKFNSGVLEVPCFLIDENTESLFRNLIAFEQMNPQFGNDITTYIAFMSQFISTSEDVALLASRGIIVHLLDSDNEVPAMFTRLGTHVHFDFGADSYHYLKNLWYILEEYYQSRLSRWMAWLWRNHFSNPWLALGVLAAIIVLVCTIVQTIFTVLAYRQPH
ncbi:hypothetical protein ACP4OV_026151 [Aristida adscensionis]